MVSSELDQLREQILNLTRQYANKLLAPTLFSPGKDHVPVSAKVLTSDDFSALVNSSLDGWLTAGRFTADFEGKLAQFVGARSALFVNSGSSANLVALSSLTIPKPKNSTVNWLKSVVKRYDNFGVLTANEVRG